MLSMVPNHEYWIRPLILSSLLTHLNNNVLWLNVCYNEKVLKIIWILLVLTNHYAKGLLLNTNVWKHTKRIYQNAGKCDDKQKLKDVIYSDMVSTTEVLTDNSPNVAMTSTPVKKIKC